MKSNYKKLKDFIVEKVEFNEGNKYSLMQGVSNKKYFQKAKTNIIDVDLSKYRIAHYNQFVFNRATTRNGGKISIALRKGKSCMVSPSYRIFEVADENILHPDYLMMWFSRPEFDRYARFKSHGSAHEFFDMDEMRDIDLPIPSLEKQKEFIAEYEVIENRIQLNKQLCTTLEKTAQVIFSSHFEKTENNELHRLGDLIEIKGGFSYTVENVGKGETYLLGMGCVSYLDRFVEGGMKYYSDDVPDQHLVGCKDIIIATRQQSENFPILGCPAMIPPNLGNLRMVIASNLYRVINNSHLSNEIIYQILKSKKYQERIRFQTKGTTVGMITKDAIEEYFFYGPSIADLQRIEKDIETLVDHLFLKRAQTQKLEELKSLLLEKMAVKN